MHHTLPGEEWREISGYEGEYAVSNLGRVRSLTRTDWRGRRLIGKILKPIESGGKRLAVKLPDGNRLIHRLVLEAFVGPCPEGMEACHGMNGFLDNSVSNLRWDTRSENMKDKKRHRALLEELNENATI